jgi:hypothetical protein
MRDHEGRTIHGRTITVQTGFSGGQLIFAILGGALAGTVAGLLLAPRSGAETRAWWRGLSGQAKERMAGLPEALRQAGAAAVEAFDEATANGVPLQPRPRSTPPPTTT